MKSVFKHTYFVIISVGKQKDQKEEFAECQLLTYAQIHAKYVCLNTDFIILDLKKND